MTLNRKYDMKRLRWVIAAAAFALCFAAGARWAGAPGITWDEGSDLHSAGDVVEWVEGLPGRPLGASFSRQRLLDGWGNDWKHGPVSRVIHAGAWFVFSRFSSDVWFRRVTAFRLGTVFAFALLCGLVALAGWRAGVGGEEVGGNDVGLEVRKLRGGVDGAIINAEGGCDSGTWGAAGFGDPALQSDGVADGGCVEKVGGDWGGVMAGISGAVFFACMPRVFGHGLLCATDVIGSLLFFGACMAGWMAAGRRRSIKWTVVFGVLLAVAVLAKESGALALPLFAGLMAVRRPPGWGVKVVLAVAVAAVVYFALQPLYWASPVEAARRYFGYILHAGGGGVAVWSFYFGRRYVGSPPWHFPFVMLGITVPLLTLGVFAAVCAAALRGRNGFAIWLLVCCLSVPVFFALGFAPAYDCERLLLPCCGFMAALAGLGAARVAGLARGAFGRGKFRDAAGFSAFLRGFVVVAVFVGISVFTLARATPMGHVYFNGLIGGLPGAVRHGFDVDYWGASVDRGLIGEMNRTLPVGARLSAVGYNVDNLVFYQDIGLLRGDVVVVNYGEPALAVLICNRPGVFDRRAWRLFQRVKPVTAVLRGGVLLSGVFPVVDTGL